MGAVIYARYSAGPRQTDQSIEGQVRVCTEFCRQHGLTVQEVYADRHISGTTDERPEFQRLIKDAKLKKFDTVVIYKTDRFARNKYDSAIYKRQLKKANVRLLYAAEAIPEGPEGIILESLMEGLAEYYSAELSQKVKRGVRESALKGKVMGSIMPFGLSATADHKYAPDPETAPFVRKIFEMYIEGKIVADICRYLNERGVKTSTGGKFNQNSINRILKNKKYMGVYENAGIELPDIIPPIISKETFYLAQREMEQRRTGKAKRKNTADYLLAGKLFCGHCGSPMYGISGTSKTGRTYYYYTCAEQRKRRCNKTSVNRDQLEDEVVRLTKDYLLQNGIIREIAEKMYALQAESDTTKEDLKQYNKKLRDNKISTDNLISALERGVATDIIFARLASLEDEKQAILGEIAYLQSIDFGLSVDQLEFFLLQYIQGENEDPIEYRKRMITGFVSKVILYDNKIEITYTLTDKDHLRQSAAAFESSYRDSQTQLIASSHELDSTVVLRVLPGAIILEAPV